MDRGYLPIFRKIEDNPIWGDNLLFAIWVKLLLKVNYIEKCWWNGREMINVLPGQTVLSWTKLAEYLCLPRTTIRRKIELLKERKMLDTYSDKYYTVITIRNYSVYKDYIRKFGQINGCKADNNPDAERTEEEVEELFVEEINEIIGHLNQTFGTNYSPETRSTIVAIRARLKEGYSVGDFKMVHIKKSREWIGTRMERYLRPSTLYRPGKFEEYLNQKIKEPIEEKISWDHPK